MAVRLWKSSRAVLWAGFGGLLAIMLAGLLVLCLPVVMDRLIVVRNPAFVLRIMKLIGHIDQQGFLTADHFVAMSNTGRNEDLPRAQGPDVECIAQTKSGRTTPQVDEGDLQEAFDRSPAVGLMEVIMKGLNRAGVV